MPKFKPKRLYYRDSQQRNNSIYCDACRHILRLDIAMIDTGPTVVYTIRARRNKPSEVRRHSVVRRKLELFKVEASLLPHGACNEKVAADVIAIRDLRNEV